MNKQGFLCLLFRQKLGQTDKEINRYYKFG